MHRYSLATPRAPHAVGAQYSSDRSLIVSSNVPHRHGMAAHLMYAIFGSAVVIFLLCFFFVFSLSLLSLLLPYESVVTVTLLRRYNSTARSLGHGVTAAQTALAVDLHRPRQRPLLPQSVVFIMVCTVQHSGRQVPRIDCYTTAP